MAHSKIKLNTNEIPAFRKFLESRGFKCRDGKGDWQALQVQNITDRGWKAFCLNTKGVVTSPVEFDALIQVFKAPVDPVRICTPSEALGQDVAIPSPALMKSLGLWKENQHDSDLLDDFAIAALTIVATFTAVGAKSPDYIAERAYTIAKAMMAERANHQPK